MAEFGEVTIEGEGVSIDQVQYPQEEEETGGEGGEYYDQAAVDEQGEYVEENQEFDGASVEYQLNDTLDVCCCCSFTERERE